MDLQKQLYDDVYHLTNTIGERLTGSENERKAAEYIRDRFLEYVPECTMEEFPIMQRDIKKEELEVMVDGEWTKFSVCAYNPSPSTDGKTVEAELVYFDGHTDSQREDWSYLKGKAVLHNGNMIAKDHYKRLMEAKPAFLLMVDTRYTSSECIANGMSTSSIEKYGAVPIVNIAFMDAVKICAHKSTKARLTIEGGAKKSTSQNVVAELPGTDKDAGVLYFGAHIDGVAGSPGADDNAVGCAILLSIASVLCKKPHRKTIRFVAFGAEEQLSVGSAEYVRRHRKEIEEKGVFMCNFDSCSSAVGWYKFVINADEKLRNMIKKVHNERDMYYIEELTPDPYNDLFSFTAAGIPGITYMRNNCEMGRYYHHQPGNSIEALSMEVAENEVLAASEMMEKLADTDDFKGCGVNPDVKDKVKTIWENTYGGWK